LLTLGITVFMFGQSPSRTLAQTRVKEPDTSEVDTATAEQKSRAERWRKKRRAKSEDLSPPTPSFGDRIRRFIAEAGGSLVPHRRILNVPELEVAGIRPVFGGLAGEAGLAGGLRYESPFLRSKRHFATAEALGSLRRYYTFESVAGFDWGRYVAYGYARYQHQPREKFYGIGPEPGSMEGSLYRIDQALSGGLFARSLSDRVLLGGQAAYQTNRLGDGRGSGPKIRTQFGSLPGVNADTDYLMMGTFFEFDSRDASYDRAFARRFAPTEQRLRRVSLEARRGFYVAAEVTHNVNTRADNFDFTRFTLDIREFLPVGHELMHGFAFRQFASVTQSPDGQVPFYRLQSIGGARSLRGYDAGQFRDRNVLLTNVEARCQVWHWLDMALFGDVGQVFRDVEDARLGDPHIGYGLGFRIKRDGQTLGRLDVVNSEEGITTHIDLGSLF
jgi:hypothetical protein